MSALCGGSPAIHPSYPPGRGEGESRPGLQSRVASPARAEGRPAHHSWIGNREVPGRGPLRDAVDPADGRPFASATLLDAEQAASAVLAAHDAFPAWSAASFEERGRLLLRLRDLVLEQADDIAGLIQREQGKPAAEAQAVEIFPSLEALKHLALHAEDVLRDDATEGQSLLLAHKDSRVVYSPLGPVLVITPWNYPFGIAMTGIAAALAAGNTVVLKPAPATTLIGLRIGALAHAAGFPDGVVNVVAVDDAVAPALTGDPRIAKIVFTGSTATGRKIMTAAAANLTPVLLELGGKDPAVVCRDADLDRAARGVMWGAFVNAGQTCASVERVYVEAEVADAFIAKVVEETARLRVGGVDGDVGPMTMERQRRIVEDHVADAVARGATVRAGGVTPAGPGWFYPPTVLSGVDHTMRVMREETFGPVLPIMAVGSLEEAIRLANDSEYGLTASGWTRDRAVARRLAEELSAGVVTINDCVYSYGEPTAPWGGVRHSGIGRTHGALGLREMVSARYVASEFRSGPNLWWYPYGSDFHRLMSAANRSQHARGFLRRLSGLVALLGFRRFWQRVSLRGIARNIDKLF
jgi:succinate-semialdehyde dehydrogenase/glutarate-semialdehyde dehydrogenase